MPGPSSIFTELVSTTFRNHGRSIVDNTSKHHALVNYLRKQGNIETEDGGLELTKPLEYAENQTYQRYSGLDVLNVQQSDVFTAVTFPWRQIALNVVSSGRELRINSGRNQIINLAKSRIKNAINTFWNNFSFDLYSDGSLTNQVNGLQALIADAGTGVVGGIDSSTWTFWRNVVQSAAAPLQGGGAITPGPTTIESLMLPAFLGVTRNNDKPNLIVASQDYFTFYEQSQTSIKRYTKGEEADGGFVSLKYKNADVIFDGNTGIPASRMYFLNTQYFKLVAHSAANLTVNEEMRPVNQDGVVVPILWMGNLLITNRSLQAVLKP